MSRPRIATTELVAAIASDLADGLPVKYAAAKHNLHPATLYNWLALGDQDEDSPDSWIFFELAKAQAQYMSDTLSRLKRAAGERGSGWQGYAWMLERRFPIEFGNRSSRTTPEIPDAPAEPTKSFRDVDPARLNG